MATIENRLKNKLKITSSDETSSSKIIIKGKFFLKYAKIECGDCDENYSRRISGFKKKKKFFQIHDSNLKGEEFYCPKCNHKDHIIYKESK